MFKRAQTQESNPGSDAMNPLQTGTSASQLEPQQNFRNSSQSGVIQQSKNSLQQSSSPLQSSPATRLRVVGGGQQQQSVLGVSNQPAVQSGTQGWVVGGVLLLSAVLAVYFFQRAVHFAPEKESNEHEQSKNSEV